VAVSATHFESKILLRSAERDKTRHQYAYLGDVPIGSPGLATNVEVCDTGCGVEKEPVAATLNKSGFDLGAFDRATCQRNDETERASFDGTEGEGIFFADGCGQRENVFKFRGHVSGVTRKGWYKKDGDESAIGTWRGDAK